MSQVLDLSITLAASSSDMPGTLADVSLQCESLNLVCSGDRLADPLTQQERDELRWYLEEYWKWPYEQFLVRGKKVEARLAQVGKRLYEAVFGSEAAANIVAAWNAKPSDLYHQISIITELPAVLSLPWELLHDGQEFLALRAHSPVSIIRRLSTQDTTRDVLPFELPLRVLYIVARPEDLGFIDPRSIAHGFLDAVQEQVTQGTLELEFLCPPTRSELQKRLNNSQRPIHILHFDGHGDFQEQGVLFFETGKGTKERVRAVDLARALRDSGLRLVVLTACKSAVSAVDNSFGSVAAQLMQEGIDAVVAMSADLLVESSIRYVKTFYQELVHGTATPIAQQRARQALYHDPYRFQVSLTREKEGKRVEVQDWWLPHLYQLRPLVLRSSREPHTMKKVETASSRWNEEMPGESRYTFNGYAHELLQIERSLYQGKLVVLSGFGGVGKTAVARETADWLTRTGMFTGACFASFEHGGDASTLLHALSAFLKGNDDSVSILATPDQQVKQLEPILKERSTLLIADNLESILPGGELEIGDSQRNVLWEVLWKLREAGAGVLLTCRNMHVVDELMTSDKRQVQHLSLTGLDANSAYALASDILTRLGIDRERVPYTELSDFLVQLNHHPLAIQLVLPMLRTTPLARVREQFAALHASFTDAPGTGHNRSLQASLEYSWRYLSNEQATLLLPLAIFEGGASEESLLLVVGLPQEIWQQKLLPALEQVALVTVEQEKERKKPASSAPSQRFVRFHPVLTPYLRNKLGTIPPLLSERYARYYYQYANVLYFQDDFDPKHVRAFVQWELPNLRRALMILVELRRLEEAFLMVDDLARFLAFLGRHRELQEIRKHVDEAIAQMLGKKEGPLTRLEWLSEVRLGENALEKGTLDAAYACFSKLLARMDALPEGASLGRGSHEYCQILAPLANCLGRMGQIALAEEYLREALAMNEKLIEQQMRLCGALLSEFGHIFTLRGRDAQQIYEDERKIYELIDHQGDKASMVKHLCLLALTSYNIAQVKPDSEEMFAMFRFPDVSDERLLTRTEWLNEIRQGEDELASGDPDTARKRFSRLLTRMEMLPEGTPPGRNSVEYCQTFYQLARCLDRTGRLSEAEQRLQRALNIIARWLQQDGRQRGIFLGELGMVLVSQCQYVQAQKAYGDALEIFEQCGDKRSAATTLGRIGDLALIQQKYGEASETYEEVGITYKDLSELGMQAVGWHQRGILALEQEAWHEAELYSREALKIYEQLKDHAHAAGTCNLLACIAERSGRPTEAEGWYKRALELIKLVSLGGSDQAKYLTNLAELLTREVQAGHMSPARLVEARSYRRRAREAFANSKSNRDAITEEFGELISGIALMAQGDMAMKEVVDEALQRFETHGWRIAAAIQRLWAGERDWHTLTRDVEHHEALLVLLVLEMLDRLESRKLLQSFPMVLRERWEQEDFEGVEAFLEHEQEDVVERVRALQTLQKKRAYASLPAAIRQALVDDDEAALKELTQQSKIAVKGLPRGKQQEDLSETIQYLQFLHREYVFSSLPGTIREAMKRKDTDACEQALNALPLEEYEDALERIQELQLLQKRQVFTSLPAHILQAWKEGDWTTLDQALKELPPEEQKEIDIGYLGVLEEKQIRASLPATIRQVLLQGEQAALDQVLETLLPEEQQKVVEAMLALQDVQRKQVLVSLSLNIREAWERVDLATIDQAARALLPEEQQKILGKLLYLTDLQIERTFTTLPTDICEPLEQDDQTALDQALERFTPEERQKIVEVIQYLDSLIAMLQYLQREE